MTSSTGKVLDLDELPSSPEVMLLKIKSQKNKIHHRYLSRVRGFTIGVISIPEVGTPRCKTMGTWNQEGCKMMGTGNKAELMNSDNIIM